MEKFPIPKQPEQEKSPDKEDAEIFYVQDHPTVGLIGKEKSDRYLALSGMRELGSFLSPEDEKEYQDLRNEIIAVHREAIRQETNTTEPIEPTESELKEITDDDFFIWGKGASAYDNLSVALQQEGLEETFEEFFNAADQNALKAVFLKEKPAVLLEEAIDSDQASRKRLIELLGLSGIRVAGRCVYDVAQVVKVIRDHPEIFVELGSSNPDTIMRALAETESYNHQAMGMVLGYPTDSVRNFNKDKMTERHMVNVYGIHWVDFGHSVESRKKQIRLKMALEKSGLLKGP